MSETRVRVMKYCTALRKEFVISKGWKESTLREVLCGLNRFNAKKIGKNRRGSLFLYEAKIADNSDETFRITLKFARSHSRFFVVDGCRFKKYALFDFRKLLKRLAKRER